MIVDHVQALLDAPEPAARNDNALAPVTYGNFQFTASGLLVEGAPGLEEWGKAGHVLAVMEKGVAFMIGDWILYGEQAFGEAAAQYIDARSFSAETVRVYTWLAAKVQPANRMIDNGLGVGHHMAVAKLPAPEQRRWLRRAITEPGTDKPWSVSRLKSAIREGYDLPVTGWALLVTCGSEAQRDRVEKAAELEGATVQRRDVRKRDE